MWESLNADRWIMLGNVPHGQRDIAVPLYKPAKYEVMLSRIVEMTKAGASIDLISRALGIGAAVMRDALHLHRTEGAAAPSQRRPKRHPSQPFVPKYQRMTPEVDRRRKAGEGFDRLAR